MPILSRRHFLIGTGAVGLSLLGVGAYATGIEPVLLLRTTHYAPQPPQWPSNYPLKIAILSDIHAYEPGMSAARLVSICEQANAWAPDLTLILGDFNAGHNFASRAILAEEWAEALTHLQAPLGIYAILGNHDWWHGPLPNMPGNKGENVRRGLARAHINLLENDAIFIRHGGRGFWLAGLADQMAYWFGRGRFKGLDDLEGTLARVKTADPVILLAHEPMIFHQVPNRVALTLCGHTHGGQIRLPFIGTPFAKARFGENYVYGHVVEGEKHMIISAGLGTSIVPVRFFCLPELVFVTLGPLPSTPLAT